MTLTTNEYFHKKDFIVELEIKEEDSREEIPVIKEFNYLVFLNGTDQPLEGKIEAGNVFQARIFLDYFLFDLRFEEGNTRNDFLVQVCEFCDLTFYVQEVS